MKKLIGLLNELAVAEAETEAIEQEMRADAHKVDALEDKWDEAYKVEFGIFNRTVEYLMNFGIEATTARKMLRTKRAELVKIAEKEV